VDGAGGVPASDFDDLVQEVLLVVFREIADDVRTNFLEPVKVAVSCALFAIAW
jgi:hypothetical protein